MKIKHKLIAGFLLIVLVPIIALITLSQSAMKDAITEDYEKIGRSESKRAATQSFPDLIDQARNYVKFIALDANVVKAAYYANSLDTTGDIKTLLDSSVSELGLSYIELSDEKGKVTYSTDSERIGKNIRQYDIVQAAAVGNHLSDIEYSEDFSQFVIHTAARLVRKEKSIGFIHGGYIIDQAMLSKVVGGLTSLVDLQSKIIATTGAAPTEMGFIDAATKKEQFSHAQEVIDGVPYMLVGTPIFGKDKTPVGTLIISQSAVEMNEKLASIRITFITLGFIFIVIACAVGFYVTQSIIKPIDRLKIMAANIAKGEGDLTQRIEIKSNDEIGELATEFNTFIDKIQSLVHDIGITSSPLHAASDELSVVANETGSTILQQRKRIDSVATAVNEMAASSHEIATNAETVAGATENVDLSAQQGASVIAESITATNQLAEQVKSASNVIDQLEKDSANVATVLDVIKGIAEQTNLLALNAAIEAARAGEQGRGFAVVADEVRTLAQRTQTSTIEIHTIIESLQTGASNAVQVMELGNQQATLSVEKASVANESFTEIASAITSMSDMIREIASAVEEQSSVAENISRDVTDITDFSEKTAEGAVKTTDNSEKLANLASELKLQVGRFKV